MSRLGPALGECWALCSLCTQRAFLERPPCARQAVCTGFSCWAEELGIPVVHGGKPSARAGLEGGGTGLRGVLVKLMEEAALLVA